MNGDEERFMTADPIEPTRPLQTRRRAIVVGASAGIGAALVSALADAGYRVAALARREERLATLCAEVNARHPGQASYVVHDVTDTELVPALFQEIAHDLGGLDLIVYVAGAMPPVGPEEYDTPADALTVQVNLLGAMAWLNEAAVRFHQARGGHIVGIGSIAGDRGRRAKPAYHASKAGLHTYLESLRNRLSQYGVTVTTIKPGHVKTAMLEGVARQMWPLTPAEAAAQMVKAIQEKRGTVYVPARWALVSLVVRHMPSIIFRRLNF